jgi:hypothetical protein
MDFFLFFLGLFSGYNHSTTMTKNIISTTHHNFTDDGSKYTRSIKWMLASYTSKKSQIVSNQTYIQHLNWPNCKAKTASHHPSAQQAEEVESAINIPLFLKPEKNTNWNLKFSQTSKKI